MQQAAIVLCGGRSRRMGCDKALLPFGGEPLLVRVVRRLEAAVDHTMIVSAREQPLPSFAELGRPPILLRDRHFYRGPLTALAAGLAALPAGVEAAFVCGVDYPLLRSKFVERMFALLEAGDDIVAAKLADRLHPLAAVYRPRVLAPAESLLADGQLRLMGLIEACRTRIVEPAAWRDIDPHDHSLRNCNTPEQYALALKIAEK